MSLEPLRPTPSAARRSHGPTVTHLARAALVLAALALPVLGAAVSERLHALTVASAGH